MSYAKSNGDKFLKFLLTRSLLVFIATYSHAAEWSFAGSRFPKYEEGNVLAENYRNLSCVKRMALDYAAYRAAHPEFAIFAEDPDTYRRWRETLVMKHVRKNIDALNLCAYEDMLHDFYAPANTEQTGKRLLFCGVPNAALTSEEQERVKNLEDLLSAAVQGGETAASMLLNHAHRSNTIRLLPPIHAYLQEILRNGVHRNDEDGLKAKWFYLSYDKLGLSDDEAVKIRQAAKLHNFEMVLGSNTSCSVETD